MCDYYAPSALQLKVTETIHLWVFIGTLSSLLPLVLPTQLWALATSDNSLETRCKALFWSVRVVSD